MCDHRWVAEFDLDTHTPAVETVTRAALSEWFTTIRDAIINGNTVNLSAYPDRDQWRDILTRHAAPLLARVWQHAFDLHWDQLASRSVTAATSDNPDDHLRDVTPSPDAEKHVEVIVNDLADPDGTPTTLLDIIRTDVEEATGRVAAGNVVARVESLLSVDGPDTRTRRRITALEAIIDDPESTPEQRRRARADLSELESGIRVEDHQWTGTLRRITHDAVHASRNSADVESARQWAEATGEELVKTWLSAGDHRVRPSHVQLNRTSVALSEPFTVNNARLDYPGDPTAPPWARMRCRCTLLYETPEEAGLEPSQPAGQQPAFDDEVADVAPAADLIESEGLETYTGPLHEEINKTLRGLGEPLERWRERVENAVSDIDRVFNNLPPLERAVQVTRGVVAADALFGDNAEGAVVTDAGYMSTTFDPDISDRFMSRDDMGSGALVIITVPAGAKAALLLDDGEPTGESEVLLPRGTSIRIVSDQPENGVRTLRAEVITSE